MATTAHPSRDLGPHGIDLAAPGGIDALIAFHRTAFGDARMEDDGGGEGGAGGGGGEGGEGSFPANTPWKDMKAGEQVAYWQHMARQHETRAKDATGKLKDLGDVDALRAKAARADALERDLMSETDKQVAAAREEAAKAARTETSAKYVDRLVDAELRAAASGRIDPDRLAAVAGLLDRSRLLTPEGDVDAAKVAAFIDGVAGTGQQDEQLAWGGARPRRGPSPQGLGRTGGPAARTPQEIANDYIAKKFGKPAS